MKRRAFLKWTVVATGALAAGGGTLFVMTRPTPLVVDASNWPGITPADIELINAVANIIIPPTDTPGAGDVGVGTTIASIVTDCYLLEDRALFAAGLRALQDDCEARYGTPFTATPAADQARLIRSLDREQLLQTRLQEVSRRAKRIAGGRTGELIASTLSPTMQPHYFRQLKGLIVVAYCTSQRGATEALRYVAIPGAYKGAIPYKRGDRAWAS